MIFFGILAGLVGALVGAVLIAGAILVAFRLCGMQRPVFANVWKAAFLASAAVIIVDGLGTPLLPEGVSAIVVLAVGLSTAFLAYAHVLATPEGEPMGHKAAALALSTHTVFSLASFLFLFPAVIGLVS